MTRAAVSTIISSSREWLTGFLDPANIATVEYDLKIGQVTNASYFGNTKHRHGDMVDTVNEKFAALDEAQKKELTQLIAALSSEAQLPRQHEADVAP